jgi:hypothetical protein
VQSAWEWLGLLVTHLPAPTADLAVSVEFYTINAALPKWPSIALMACLMVFSVACTDL